MQILRAAVAVAALVVLAVVGSLERLEVILRLALHHF